MSDFLTILMNRSGQPAGTRLRDSTGHCAISCNRGPGVFNSLATRRRILRRLLGLLLLTASTLQAQFNYTTNAGTITITRYNGAGGDVAIPAAINGLPVTDIGYEAFEECYALTGVTIPDSVTNIGVLAFGACSSLKTVAVPGSVISIGNNAFDGCHGLINVTIDAGVTSIGQQAFDSCFSITNVAIPGSVTNIGTEAFGFCSALTSVPIPNGVTGIGSNAFLSCSGLTSVTIPESVTNIGFGAWGGCQNLSAITVDPLNTFFCSLNGVLFDKNQTVLVQCPAGLTGSVAVPGSVTNIETDAFEFCSGVTNITMPDSVKTIGDRAFAYCSALTNVLIPNGVTYIGFESFTGCTGLSSVKIPNGVTNISAFAFSYCFGVTNVTIPESVVDIGQEAFDECTSLTSIRIPGSVTNIEELAFGSCGSLTSAYFLGNAPAIIYDAFSSFASDDPVTVYYLPDTTGWSSFFTTAPVVLWNPLIQTGDGSFGFQNNQFGFNVTGTSNLVVVVEAAANLAAPVWTPRQTLTLTNGVSYFSEPAKTNVSSRFYRLSPP